MREGKAPDGDPLLSPGDSHDTSSVVHLKPFPPSNSAGASDSSSYRASPPEARAASYFGSVADVEDAPMETDSSHGDFRYDEQEDVDIFSDIGNFMPGNLTDRASNLWNYFARRSSVAIDSFLQQHRLQQPDAGQMSACQEELLSDRTPRLASAEIKNLSYPKYMLLLCFSFFSTDVVKQKLSRITLMEALEHFDMVNDLFFLVRVAWAIHRGFHWRENKSAKFVMAWLVTTYIISCCAYALRRFLIYNRISKKSSGLFYPLVVFKEIRRAGEESPEDLFMFERLCWTYQLLMRVIEDLPQVLLSILFLINEGRDTYAMVMIAYSSTMFFITTIRMGLRYPFKGTLYLLLSSEPPVDDPVALEAAPTTYYMTLFMSGVFALWSVTYLFTLRYVNKVWRVLMIMMAAGFALLSVFCLLLFVYYRRQREVDVDEAFLGGTARDGEENRAGGQESLVPEI
ncbi:insulin-degrading enzyme [Toxoplasma gondii RUB]|uniref:Insulin-degrading enzyme n=9 Tax=Toxoplasma gondii TaxID=5811 RepID=S7UT62_TOXGG|nr:insulin-degrading enzyme [Toxoplasma gondii GT1]KAF4639163.1 insulin-degrading enzyme [Toxoplasma gondii]KFG40691.1 insulin-degrading enzyme [Toxoplasma gondii p89]KFG44655.1 insulin-degrading enzyme [Toxoplasma gondii GAB2-2007-GAL-DOM2]KFG55744.1 insulin-degrading enzyme [Toxoplasma gondii FOU]KFG57819.1 insulin-degrading enzyme [Toxoplasma gondii RUB]KFH13020.1 insulin-degrading enzyme [Toxoplasma gondii MAS]PUA91981.1 insulin-degrading enzyme [Toxoplasma gondii TgCATBr9]RQX72340.1 in